MFLRPGQILHLSVQAQHERLSILIEDTSHLLQYTSRLLPPQHLSHDELDERLLLLPEILHDLGGNVQFQIGFLRPWDSGEGNSGGGRFDVLVRHRTHRGRCLGRLLSLGPVGRHIRGPDIREAHLSRVQALLPGVDVAVGLGGDELALPRRGVLLGRHRGRWRFSAGSGSGALLALRHPCGEIRDAPASRVLGVRSGWRRRGRSGSWWQWRCHRSTRKRRRATLPPPPLLFLPPPPLLHQPRLGFPHFLP
mmetsp:Transcript_16628/g.47893  ORF Transcript_16628/g.47893 Transcript_16628/m.47893 type:complete len:251 (-) Transcript_16628:1519-2271(-)